MNYSIGNYYKTGYKDEIVKIINFKEGYLEVVITSSQWKDSVGWIHYIADDADYLIPISEIEALLYV